MRKQCAVCPAEFDAKRAAARYCSERCRKRAQRQPGKAAAPPLPPDPGAELYSATLAELTAAGRVPSAAGQAALLLARRIDASQGETIAGLAAAVKQHGATLADAVKDGRAAASPLDELRARRESNRAAG